MAKLPDFEGLAIFAKVVELRSFAAAAGELALSKATVSKPVPRLDERLGARRCNRTSRRLALAAAGQKLSARPPAVLAGGGAGAWGGEVRGLRRARDGWWVELHQFRRRAGERAPRGTAARQQWRGADAGSVGRARHRRSAGVHRRRRHRLGRSRGDPEGLEADRRLGASGDAARRPAPRARRGAGGFPDQTVCEGKETEVTNEGWARLPGAPLPTLRFGLGYLHKNQELSGEKP